MKREARPNPYSNISQQQQQEHPEEVDLYTSPRLKLHSAQPQTRQRRGHTATGNSSANHANKVKVTTTSQLLSEQITATDLSQSVKRRKSTDTFQNLQSQEVPKRHQYDSVSSSRFFNRPHKNSRSMTALMREEYDKINTVKVKQLYTDEDDDTHMTLHHHLHNSLKEPKGFTQIDDNQHGQTARMNHTSSSAVATKDTQPSWSLKATLMPRRKSAYINNTSIKQIEEWLSGNLCGDKNQYQGVDGGKASAAQQQLQTNSAKSALFAFNIDRITLIKLLISQADADRLYRILYVTTAGFYQTLQDLFAHQSSTCLITNIWHAFQVILQATCKTQFKDMHEQNRIQAEERILKAEADSNLRRGKLEDENKLMAVKLTDFEKIFQKLTDERIQAEQLTSQANFNLLKVKRMLEEEVKLRLEFENKINKLNNYNRKLQVEAKALHQSQTECNRNIQDTRSENQRLESKYLEFKTKSEAFAQEQERNSLEKGLFKKQYEELQTKHQNLFTDMQALQTALRQKMATSMSIQMVIQKKDTQISSQVLTIASMKEIEQGILDQKRQIERHMDKQEVYIQESLSQKLEETNEEFKIQQEQHTAKVSQSELEHQRKRIEELDTKLKKIYLKSQEKSDEITRLTSRLKRQDEQIEKLHGLSKQHLAEIAAQKDEAKQLQLQLNITTEMKQHYSVQIRELKIQIAEFDRKTSGIRDENQTYKGKISSLETTVGLIQQNNSFLQLQIEEHVEKQANGLRKLKQQEYQTKLVQDNLREEQQKTTLLSKAQEEHLLKITYLKEKVKRLKLSLTGGKVKLILLAIRLSFMIRMVQSLRFHCQKMYDRMSSQIHKIQTENTDKANLIYALSSELESLIKSNEKLTGKVNEDENHINRLELKNSSLMGKLFDLQKEHVQMQTDKQKVSDVSQDLQVELNETVKERDELVHLTGRQKTALEIKDRTIDKQLSDFKSLVEKYNLQKSQNKSYKIRLDSKRLFSNQETQTEQNMKEREAQTEIVMGNQGTSAQQSSSMDNRFNPANQGYLGGFENNKSKQQNVNDLYEGIRGDDAKQQQLHQYSYDQRLNSRNEMDEGTFTNWPIGQQDFDRLKSMQQAAGSFKGSNASAGLIQDHQTQFLQHLESGDQSNDQKARSRLGSLKDERPQSRAYSNEPVQQPVLLTQSHPNQGQHQQQHLNQNKDLLGTLNQFDDVDDADTFTPGGATVEPLRISGPAKKLSQIKAKNKQGAQGTPNQVPGQQIKMLIRSAVSRTDTYQ